MESWGPVPLSLPGLLRLGARGRDDKAALIIPERHGGEVTRRIIRYGELWQRVDQLAAGFRALGVREGDRVAILMRNRPEWVYADLALLSLGAVDVPLWVGLASGQIQAALADAECVGAVVDAGESATRLAGAGFPLRWVAGADAAPVTGAGTRSIALAEVASLGEGAPAPCPSDIPGPDTLATLLYTSGTTGSPKGVMLTHGNLVANVESIQRALPVDSQDLFFSLLPLSHVFERTAGHYVALSLGATIAYARAPQHAVEEMGLMRPTVIPTVPFLLERVRAGFLNAMAVAPRPRRALMRWALAVAARETVTMRRGPRPSPRRLSHRLADALVFRALRRKLGDRVKFFVSGGAPLAPDVEEFFWAAGIRVLQGYGLTETSPVTNVNRPDSSRPGTVGPAIPGVEIRLAADGEILVRGPNVMKGYWKHPEETAQALDGEGWLRTGDIGTLSADGYLAITDRKKDFIVLATGKNIAPRDVEPVFANVGWISQILVVGEGRPYLAALVVPEFGRLAREFPELPADPASRERMFAESPQVAAFLGAEIARAQSGLAPYQRIRRFRLLGREFSVEEDEMTPLRKLKRGMIARRRADLIASLYRDDPGTWAVPKAAAAGRSARGPVQPA